ncbi:unnamed protein product, partial [Prorocentrum cordatum]
RAGVLRCAGAGRPGGQGAARRGPQAAGAGVPRRAAWGVLRGGQDAEPVPAGAALRAPQVAAPRFAVGSPPEPQLPVPPCHPGAPLDHPVRREPHAVCQPRGGAQVRAPR